MNESVLFKFFPCSRERKNCLGTISEQDSFTFAKTRIRKQAFLSIEINTLTTTFGEQLKDLARSLATSSDTEPVVEQCMCYTSCLSQTYTISFLRGKLSSLIFAYLVQYSLEQQQFEEEEDEKEKRKTRGDKGGGSIRIGTRKMRVRGQEVSVKNRLPRMLSSTPPNSDSYLSHLYYDTPLLSSLLTLFNFSAPILSYIYSIQVLASPFHQNFPFKAINGLH